MTGRDESPGPPAENHSPPPARRGTTILLFVVPVALPVFWLWKVLIGRHVLLPIPLLEQIAPWGTPLEGRSWNPLFWDAVAFFQPVRRTAVEAVMHGHLPLWNPAILCGSPLLADVQSAVLYPPNLLFLLFPVERAFGISAYLHLAAAGGFTTFWLRREGLSVTAAILGGVVFAVGGWSMAWLELPVFMATAAWLPLLLGLLAGTGAGRRCRAAAGCSIAVGLMLTAGHLQIAFYCLLGAVGYAVIRDGLERRLIRFPVLVSGAILGTLLASPQLLPAKRLSEISHRSTVADANGYRAFIRQASTTVLLDGQPARIPPLVHLPRFFAPGFFGIGSGDEFRFGETSEWMCYVGMLPLLLGSVALGGWRRSPAVVALAGIALAGCLLAFGTPLNAPLYFGVPGFARFGSPNRALILFAISWSGLAAFGWDRICARRSKSAQAPKKEMASPADSSPEPPASRSPVQLPRWKPGLAIFSIVFFLSLTTSLAVLPAAIRWPVLLLTGIPALARAVIYMLLALTLIAFAGIPRRWIAPAGLALVVVDLWTFGHAYNQTGPAEKLHPPPSFHRALRETAADGRIAAVNPSWPLTRAPSAVLPPNLAATQDVLDIGGYEGAYLLSYKSYLNDRIGRDASPVTNGNLVMPPRVTPELIRDLAVRAVVFATGSVPEQAALELGLSRVESDTGWSLYRVSRPTSRAEFHRRWPPAEGATGMPLRLTGDRTNPNRVSIAMEGHGAGYVLLRDSMAEGWRVFIDGNETQPIESGSPVLRVVRVDEMAREVTWNYMAPGLAAGWRLCAVGLVLTLLALTAGFTRCPTR